MVVMANAGQARQSTSQSSADAEFRRAVSLYEVERTPEASRAVDEILRTHPAHVPSLMLKAQMLEDSGEFSAAQPYYERALKLAPRDPQILFLFGCNWLHRHHWPHAITYLEKSRSLRPKHIDTLYYLSQAHHLNGDDKKAIPTIRECARLAPDTDYVCQKMGDLLLATEEYQEGLKWLLKARQLNPNLEKLDEQIGAAYYAILKIPEAIENFKRALKKNPNDPQACYLMAKACAKTSDWENAKKYYQLALQLKGDDATLRFGLGRSLVGLGEYEAALGPLKHALELDPTQVEAHFQLGRAYRGLGMKEEAAGELMLYQMLKDLASADSSLPKQRLPNDQDLWNRCRELLEENREAKVISLLKKAIGTDMANSGIPYMNLGVIYNTMGRPEDALKPLLKAIEISPKLAYAHSHLGLSYLALDELDQAEQAFESELKLAPSEVLALAGMGQVKYREAKWAEAVDYFERSKTTDSMVLWMLCDSYFRLGKPAQARLTAEAIQTFARSNNGVLSSLASLLDRENQHDLAEKVRAKIPPR